MTPRERAIIETYTGICMTTGEQRNEVYKYMNEIMGRPVYTHELALKELQDELKEKSKEDFINLCRKPQTNADRIRAMSDEELAELLVRQHACEHCEYHGRNATCKAPSEFTCTNLYAEGITLRWLKSEVKE